MKKSLKIKIGLIIFIVLFLLICCPSLYLLNRSIHMKNNDLLLTYEALEPITVTKEKVGNIEYTHLFYGDDIGWVIIGDDGIQVIIRDNRHGFLKEYKNGVLYYEDDFRKEEFFGEIKSYFNPKFWFGMGRHVIIRSGKIKRTIEECEQIGQLLKEKEYDQIKENNKNTIVQTNSGTYFVN